MNKIILIFVVMISISACGVMGNPDFPPNSTYKRTYPSN